ncbi:MAG: hypothetical protein IPH18_15935 [Chitinophagaceae bacterium]|nr:hypothetical protein [Chitinophagaceae bacterium]
MHNICVLDSVRQEKQLKGFFGKQSTSMPTCPQMVCTIKQMEDLAMKYMEPDVYKDIARKLAETKERAGL